MKVGDEFAQLILIDLVPKARHHVSSANNALLHVLIVRGQAAGKIWLLKKVLQPRPFIAVRRIRWMASEAINIKNFAASCLLLVQPQFGVRHRRRGLAAAGQQRGKNCHHKNGRYQLQMTIMSGAQLFENPGVVLLLHAS